MQPVSCKHKGFHTESPCVPPLPRQIEAHEDDVNAVAFADGSSQLLYSGSDDALCKVWDRRTLRETRPQPVGQLAGHRDGITFIHSKVGEGWVSNSNTQCQSWTKNILLQTVENSEPLYMDPNNLNMEQSRD